MKLSRSKYIYLAGKFEESEVIKGYADQLRALGHHITYPWFELHVGKGDPDFAKEAWEDAAGVSNADWAVFVFEKDLPYSGAMTELGMALALGKITIIIGEGGKRNIFTHHPAIYHVKDWSEFYGRVKGPVQRRRKNP